MALHNDENADNNKSGPDTTYISTYATNDKYFLNLEKAGVP